jgi:hypothetical protein
VRCAVAALAVVACGGVEQGVAGQLSSEGLYADIARKTITDDARELSPAYELWSDGAVKRRWIRLPPGGEIDTTDMDHWQLPVGTKLFKEFAVGGRRIETRLIERVGSDDYRFEAFVWLPDESDAVLASEGVTDVYGTGYDVPSTELCMTCHTSEPGRSLGVSAVQLAGMLDDLPLTARPVRQPVIPEPALGVLHANCGHCHTEGGTAPMQTLRVSVADSDRTIEDTAIYRTTVGQPVTVWIDHGVDYRIVPGNADASAIAVRMSRRGSIDQMPPIGTNHVYDEGLTTVRQWIDSLAP